MISFNFITDDDFRHSLEADVREMHGCRESGAFKAAHVMAGSIIEAVLIDYVTSMKLSTQKEALKLDFSELIQLCRDQNVLSLKTIGLCGTIKEYRNLIHAGRVYRLKETVSKESAEIAVALVTIISNEIAIKKRENYGYTAEQIVSKLEADNTAEAILPDLLKKTNSTEVERFLLKVGVHAYAASQNDPDVASHICASLSKFFRLAFKNASPELQKKVAERFAQIVREESGTLVTFYGEAFFRCGDLKFLAAEDIDMVKRHYLSRLKGYNPEAILKALSGIGSHLSKSEVAKFSDPLVKLACGSDVPVGVRKDASRALSFAISDMPTDIANAYRARIDQWISTFRGQAFLWKVQTLEQIKTESQAVPF